MAYSQAQDPKGKFMARIAFNFAVFLTLATLMTAVSADQSEDVGNKPNEVVDDEGTGKKSNKVVDDKGTGKKRSPAPVEVTGQTECGDPETGELIPCEGTGEDGDLQAGVKWPKPRFTVNNNGTVTDNLTGLIWMQNANCFNRQRWSTALEAANNLADGQCGLKDGSKPGDWRLPNINELQSLINYGITSPALPRNHPFENVQLLDYWSSTTFVADPIQAWVIFTDLGSVFFVYKAGSRFIWAVRGGLDAIEGKKKHRAPVEVTGQT